MKKINFSLIALLMILSSCQKPIEFSGLKHTALGKAKIQVDKNLIVTNFGKNGNDGISSELGRASSWTADLALINTNDSEVKFNVFGNVSEDKPLKPLSEMLFNVESNKVSISAKFATPTNDLELYNNDSLVYALRDISASTAFPATWWLPGCNPPEFYECCPCISFGQLPGNGACNWSATADNPIFTFQTETGQVTGNRFVIAEHFDEGYSLGRMIFQKMNITASNLDSLIIFSERVEK